MLLLYVTLIFIKIEAGNAEYSDEQMSVQMINDLKEDAGDIEEYLYPKYTCCPAHREEANCLAETEGNCKWFSNSNHPIAQAAGSQCVGESYVKCKRIYGIDHVCEPLSVCSNQGCPAVCVCSARGWCLWCPGPGNLDPRSPPAPICNLNGPPANELVINQPKHAIWLNDGNKFGMDYTMPTAAAILIAILLCLVEIHLYRQRSKGNSDFEYTELKDVTGSIDDEDEGLEDCAEIITFFRSHYNRACNQ